MTAQTSSKEATLAEAKRRGVPSDRGRFMRIHDVIATVTLSRSQIYRMIKADEFPKQARLSAATVGWWEDDVAAWLAKRRAAS